MKLVHEYFGENQNAELNINWAVLVELGLLHVHRSEVFGENAEGVKRWRRN